MTKNKPKLGARNATIMRIVFVNCGGSRKKMSYIETQVAAWELSLIKLGVSGVFQETYARLVYVAYAVEADVYH